MGQGLLSNDASVFSKCIEYERYVVLHIYIHIFHSDCQIDFFGEGKNIERIQRFPWVNGIPILKTTMSAPSLFFSLKKSYIHKGTLCIIFKWLKSRKWTKIHAEETTLYYNSSSLTHIIMYVYKCRNCGQIENIKK